MKEKETVQRIRLLEQEIRVLVEELDKQKLDMRGQLDELRLEIESLKGFLQREHPEFPETFRKMKEQTIQNKNPEWMSG